MKTQQLDLNWEAGLTDRFKTLRECLTAVVYGSRLGLSGCAASCDIAPSDLCKLLQSADGRKLDIDLLAPIIEATGDKRPIYWLVEKFCENFDMRRQRALEELSEVAKHLPELLRKAGIKA